MANKCGECQLFQGPNQICGGGKRQSANNSAYSSCFKGPASLFNRKVCGGCRLYQGPNQQCGGGKRQHADNSAISSCYSPIPG